MVGNKNEESKYGLMHVCEAEVIGPTMGQMYRAREKGENPEFALERLSG